MGRSSSCTSAGGRLNARPQLGQLVLELGDRRAGLVVLVSFHLERVLRGVQLVAQFMQHQPESATLASDALSESMAKATWPP